MICNARPVQKASVANIFAPKARIVGRNSALKVQAYKVTLKTPDGTSEIECGEDTYILDKAEVRANYLRSYTYLKIVIRGCWSRSHYFPINSCCFRLARVILPTRFGNLQRPSSRLPWIRAFCAIHAPFVLLSASHGCHRGCAP
jgi:hypothetical protein